MLRQGITSTSTAPGGQPLGAPFMQANGAGVGSSNDAPASEKDQKEIEVIFEHFCWGGLSACSLCCLLPNVAIKTSKGGKRLRMWYSNSHSMCAAWA